MATAPDSTIPSSPQSRNVASPHTPEPWAYDEDDARIYHADGDVEPTIAYIERENTSTERVKADGYLIAAARKMLDTLLTLETEVIAAIDGGEECRGRDAQLSAWAYRIGNAISHANGKAVPTENTKTIHHPHRRRHGAGRNRRPSGL
jgi:hypothetical protein